MKAAPWFKDWFNSPYYHQLYFNRNMNEAAAFIDKLIAHLNPPPASSILDVACGRGRHAIMLAAKDFDVTGVDLSENSINEALKHETENLHFYLHDMRLPFRINYFDYAVNLFTSFGYFETIREHNNAIRMIAQSLRPNGTLVLDYLNTCFAEDHSVHQSEKEIDGVKYHITKWFDETHFYKKIIIEDDQLDEPLQFTEKVHKFSLSDFTEMFSHQGLQIKEVYGDYDLGIYDVKKSPRLLMIAQKK